MEIFCGSQRRSGSGLPVWIREQNLMEGQEECRTYPMWVEFYEIVNNYFDSGTLADIMKV